MQRTAVIVRSAYWFCFAHPAFFEVLGLLSSLGYTSYQYDGKYINTTAGD